MKYWKILNSRKNSAANEHEISVKFIVTEETRFDCTEAINLIKNIDINLAFADCAYDTNEILSYTTARNISPLIFPKRSRVEQRDYKVSKVLKKDTITLP